VIRHPIGESLRERSFAITGWWTLFLLIAFVFCMIVPTDMVLGRAMGFWFFFLPAVPGFVLYFVVRLFPRYRVTHCPFCGFHELVKLTAPKRRRQADGGARL
jgi:hypothetical protein